MRQKTALLVFVASLLAAGSTLTGCATTGTQRAAKTTNTMQTVENEYRQVVSQADATNASLQNLINPDQQDLKKAFDSYKDNVDKMDKLGKKLEKDSANMSAQGQDYFSEWEKQGNTYANPQMRQLSEQRRLQLREMFAQIPQASIGVRGSLQAYRNGITDIEKYLSTDLTAKGIQNIRPVAQKAIQNGEAVKNSVSPVLSALDRVRTAMTPAGASTGSAAGGQSDDQKKDSDKDKQK